MTQHSYQSPTNDFTSPPSIRLASDIQEEAYRMHLAAQQRELRKLRLDHNTKFVYVPPDEKYNEDSVSCG